MTDSGYQGSYDNITIRRCNVLRIFDDDKLNCHLAKAHPRLFVFLDWEEKYTCFPFNAQNRGCLFPRNLYLTRSWLPCVRPSRVHDFEQYAVTPTCQTHHNNAGHSLKLCLRELARECSITFPGYKRVCIQTFTKGPCPFLHVLEGRWLMTVSSTKQFILSAILDVRWRCTHFP